jgi:hypothetical protein
MDESEKSEILDNFIEPKGNDIQITTLIDPGKVEDSPEKAKETTRSSIAKFYVYAFFGVILITFIVGLIKCFEAKDYRDMLITVSGILSGPLGFIIGYYFKSASAKD